MGLKYNELSSKIQARIIADRKSGAQNPFRTNDCGILRRDNSRDKPSLWRPAFVRDVEKIMHCPYYNRYADKTQVFSFYRNDDLTRRALHVQFVSRIARNIGSLLGLNLDLIEAIALGHDIGHAPFGHAGERFLNELLHSHCGKFFNHNIHSARVLDVMFSRNLSLQTLDGIICHNGEFVQGEYHACALRDFGDFDARIASCASNAESIGTLVPATLEGCAVRICDIVAYLGKDRQDAERANLPIDFADFSSSSIGSTNAQIINNITVDIVENSYGKNYLKLSDNIYQDLKISKKQNYDLIYKNKRINDIYENNIRPMFYDLYEKLLSDLQNGDKSSVIFKHHVDFISENTAHYNNPTPYSKQEPNQIVVDYIASMTDDYFLDLYKHLFPSSSHHVEYISYFKDAKVKK